MSPESGGSPVDTDRYFDEPYDAAFQGAAGAFSEDAADALVGHPNGRAPRLLPCPRFEEVFDAVRDGTARVGVVPIENTLAGSVHANYDLLAERDLTIVDERVWHIKHALIAAPGVTFDRLERVLSHPVALAQCESLFRRNPHLEPVPVYDTAGAVERVVRSGSTTDAAIAGRRAADVYGGVVLVDGVQDHDENFTRFLVVARPTAARPPFTDDGRQYKTSIFFTIENRPGALYDCLRPFAERRIDLSKIESRPLRGAVFEYAFYADLIGRVDDEAVADAVAALEARARSVRVLGSYPRGAVAHPPAAASGA